jgi:hypothetical protein
LSDLGEGECSLRTLCFQSKGSGLLRWHSLGCRVYSFVIGPFEYAADLKRIDVFIKRRMFSGATIVQHFFQQSINCLFYSFFSIAT